jgi:predicted DNA-binding mobile mystery protein A
MENSFKSMRIKQTDQQLLPFRKLNGAIPPKGGWIRAIRESLGMTQAQLAERLDITQQSLNDLEKSEANGRITLESLRRVAGALDCQVVYAVVPEKPLGEIRRERAREVAREQLARVSRSMKLEAQGVSERESRRQLEELTNELLQGSPRKLWQ